VSSRRNNRKLKSKNGGTPVFHMERGTGYMSPEKIENRNSGI
jgi:hypothetical protein